MWSPEDLSTVQIALGGTALTAVSVLLLYAYRLFLHPLSKFPGPKLAAISNWYEFYWDVILQGQFTHHVQDLHKKYGPIIRITPTELHIDDPEFYDQLYNREGKRDRYAYFSGRFGFASDTFSTIDHDLHRMRRRPLNPMFSAKSIYNFQPVVHSMLSRLCHFFEQYRDEGRVLPLDKAFMTYTTDIITEYSFARSYKNMESEDFKENMYDTLVAIYTTGQFALHFPLVFPILDLLPEWFVLKVQPVFQPVIGMRKDLGRKVGEIRQDINQGHREVDHPTVFHELLNADIPNSEKTDARLGDEAQLIVAAGLITTYWALTVASYHIIANKAINSKLVAELRNARMTKIDIMDWRKLEQLPYLYGCVYEGVRLAHGITTRHPRVLPDTQLTYGKWVIPKNTPVSMSNIDILMNEEIFPNPEEFNPERWEDRSSLDKYMVAFGRGSRSCLGVNLAMAELFITIATIFTRFEFELFETDIEDVKMKHAYLVPYTKWDSKGVRVLVKS